MFQITLTDFASINCNKLYWFEWVNGGRFIEKTEAIDSWPRMVIEYLEERLTWSGRASKNFVGCQMGKLLFFIFHSHVFFV